MELLLLRLAKEKTLKDKIAEIDTNELVKTWHDFDPNFFPKKPEIIEPNKGNNTIVYSTLTFQRTNLFDMNRTFVFVIYYYYSQTYRCLSRSYRQNKHCKYLSNQIF